MIYSVQAVQFVKPLLNFIIGTRKYVRHLKFIYKGTFIEYYTIIYIAFLMCELVCDAFTAHPVQMHLNLFGTL